MFYDKFVELCQLKGIRPSRAADDIGINRSTVTGWKKNGSVPTGDVLDKVSAYFNVSVDYLLGKTETKTSPDKSEDITFDDFTYAFYNESKDLTEDDKEKLLEMARIFKKHLDNKEKKKEGE